MKLNITGIKNLSKSDYEFVCETVNKTEKHNQLINSLDLEVHTSRTEGARQKYSIHAKALTERGFFKAEATEWKLNIAVKEALRKLNTHINNELKRHKGD